MKTYFWHKGDRIDLICRGQDSKMSPLKKHTFLSHPITKYVQENMTIVCGIRIYHQEKIVHFE